MEASNKIPCSERGSAERLFEQIIGDSPALEFALADVKRVAPTDSTVLVLGETGTGKELIAHAIHDLSARCGRPFIKLNCSAIPFDLLESELFGHEKGAFTGAIAQKIGRFEMADTGTLFLDEIGDLPLSLQPKLLHVLQEQEFERLGSGRTHHINVRLVAATHRDLALMVARNEFSSDLYYRLNVFPVVIPPLRERREDICQLVQHFVEVFSRRMGKRIEQIPATTMNAFIAYPWGSTNREGAVVICAEHWLVDHTRVFNNGKPTVNNENIVVREGYGYVGPRLCDPSVPSDCRFSTPFCIGMVNRYCVHGVWVPVGETEGGDSTNSILSDGGLESACWLQHRLGLAPIGALVSQTPASGS